MASMFHFLFVPLTLGLALLVAVMETKYARSGDERYKRLTKFWGKIFLINFALGVVTGLTLEFQFGTNWARYSTYVGDIFGSLLAVEATVAFFLESTFIGVWIFSWDKISRKAHAVVMWLVFAGANTSALWILFANGFMQNPVGYVMRNGRAELADFSALVTNPFAWHQIVHTITASYFLAAFLVMAISAWKMLRKEQVEFFSKSFKYGMVLGLVSIFVVTIQGHFHGNEVAKLQPAKLAAMESHWETEDYAPMSLLVVPKLDGTGNHIDAIKIPGLLSLLAFNDPSATVIGLNDIPEDERPPIALTFWSFRVMVGLGTLFIFMMLYAVWKRKEIANQRKFLWLMVAAIPLPYIAIQAGWVVAEVGRQPWIVYELMRTSDAYSANLVPGQVYFSFITMTLLYTVLGLACFGLVYNAAKKGPEGEA
jgi:cytochrome d ubiquinol oxidase subunit I